MVDVFGRHGVRFDPRTATCNRFVRYSDYAALETQLAEALKALDEIAADDEPADVEGLMHFAREAARRVREGGKVE